MDELKRTPCILITSREQQIMRSYCAFWRKDRTNYYMEEFADILHRLLEKNS